ncbi:MAG TPA: methylmalonyl-CoA mutase family protein [Chloroflexota bacterium]|nr:methylmalonyl-CoA mutase family protein [Chloroflexota bacterium]
MVDSAVQLPLFDEALSAYTSAAARASERPVRFMTTSSEPVERLYTPRDFAEDDYLHKLGFPGQWPYTRGVHATGHRGRLWTMRMFAGFGNAEETNKRFKYLLANGNAGLSVAYDMPTLYGYDTDDPQAEGEFGTCGVAVSSLADMEVLFDGIPLDEVTTSMTINSPAAMIWAMYLVNAEKRGIPWDKLSGTTQNDILKEYIAQKEYIFPPRPSTKLVVDTFDYGARFVPRWNTISISGYHIREAGATAVQELAFTLADGIQYVQSAVDVGLDVDSFAPRLSFFFDIHNDFLEEIAKLRAARRIWARVMRERFGAKEERSLWCRFHCQTAGVSLFVEQPENNIVRTTIQALAAVLGGTQSLHTNSMDEAMALPSEKAVRIALRTQQIIAHESGVPNTVDPLGGSYVIEAMTDRMEQGCLEYFARIDEMGGMLSAIERGFPQREIADSAYRYQQEVDSRERILVGVNDYLQGNEDPIEIPIHTITQQSLDQHLDRLRRVRRERDPGAHSAALQRLQAAATDGRDNLMPYIVEAVRAYATLGEMCNLLRRVYGEYREPTLV